MANKPSCCTLSVFWCSVCMVVTWLTIGLSLWFAGYERNTIVNRSLYPKESLVISHRNVQKVCSRQVCTGKTCVPIFYTCWNHYATFEYTPDADLVILNATVSTELYLWNDAKSEINDLTYQINMTYYGYYLVCPFIPKEHKDIVNCDKHEVIDPPYFLDLLDAEGMRRGAYSSWAFIAFFGLIAFCIASWYWIFPACGKLIIVGRLRFENFQWRLRPPVPERGNPPEYTPESHPPVELAPVDSAPSYTTSSCTTRMASSCTTRPLDTFMCNV